MLRRHAARAGPPDLAEAAARRAEGHALRFPHCPQCGREATRVGFHRVRRIYIYSCRLWHSWAGPPPEGEPKAEVVA